MPKCVALIAALACMGCSQSANNCNERDGLAAFERLDFDGAFKRLSGCESHADPSADALGTLAYLYAVLDTLDGYEHTEPKANTQKSYRLWLRAARMGHQESIASLASIYMEGAEVIGVPANIVSYQCFSDLASIRTDEPIDFNRRVDACLPSDN